MSATQPIEICEKCRRIRLVAIGLLMTSAVLTGYLWAHYEHFYLATALVSSIGFAVFSCLLILAVEMVVTRTELEVRRAALYAGQKDEEIRLLQDKIRDLDRSIAVLAADDDEVRMKLLSLSMHQPAAAETTPSPSPYRRAP